MLLCYGQKVVRYCANLIKLKEGNARDDLYSNLIYQVNETLMCDSLEILS